ncbi:MULTISPECIES: hypothetical protein [unclassified Streptomyces]|uniref:hypothetical protein n=1 Tax=unclassified Streptomyces TaxID=2593676 RepID=UPI0036FDDE61
MRRAKSSPPIAGGTRMGSPDSSITLRSSVLQLSRMPGDRAIPSPERPASADPGAATAERGLSARMTSAAGIDGNNKSLSRGLD